MPNRIIKESIKTSDEIDALSWFEEAMFTRLIVTVDDYGCYKANPMLIKNVLFPLKENVSVQMVSDALDTFEKVGLIKRYEHGGKQYLYLLSWMSHQRIRNKTGHYPEPYPGYFDTKKKDDCKADDTIDNLSEKQSSDSCQTVDGQSSVNCQSNPIQSNPKEGEEECASSSSSAPFFDDMEAFKIVHDHNEIFDAMKRVGFPMSDGLMEIAVGLYADYGKDVLLQAINECVGASGNKVKYLKAILANNRKPKPGKKEDAQSDMARAWKESKQNMEVG